jgi:hypothetical protein
MLAHAFELLWKGFLLVHSHALRSHRLFQERAHTAVPNFDTHFYAPAHPRAVAARARLAIAAASTAPVDETAIAMAAVQRTRYPHLDLLQLRLKAESLAKVNRRARGENARLGAQVRFAGCDGERVRDRESERERERERERKRVSE